MTTIADAGALHQWVEAIAPEDFVSSSVEEFFVKWETLGLPAFSSDELYNFSGTPEETHSFALGAVKRWSVPDPDDPTPRLSAFTDLRL